MDTRTFKHRYTDSSGPRQNWIKKMICLEMNISEKQALRYINDEVASMNNIEKALLEKVFSFSERTFDYKELVAVDKLPDESLVTQ